MPETATDAPLKPNGFPIETYFPRAVTRLIDLSLHVEGHHAANFRGDAEAMVRDGEFYGLTERELRALSHALKCCIRPSLDTVEGLEVSMSERQWGHIVQARRRFLKAMRDPANLFDRLRSQYRVTTPNELEITQP